MADILVDEDPTDWTFEQLSVLEKIDRLVTEAQDLARDSVCGNLEWNAVGVYILLRRAKASIDEDLSTVPLSMRPEVVI